MYEYDLYPNTPVSDDRSVEHISNPPDFTSSFSKCSKFPTLLQITIQPPFTLDY